MRFQPTLVLLASAALALTVQARESNQQIDNVVVKVNGNVQSTTDVSSRPPLPKVTAPKRPGVEVQGRPPGPEVTAPRQQPSKGTQSNQKRRTTKGKKRVKKGSKKVKAIRIGNERPPGPEVTAPRQPGRGVIALERPAAPEVTAPRNPGGGGKQIANIKFQRRQANPVADKDAQPEVHIDAVQVTVNGEVVENIAAEAVPPGQPSPRVTVAGPPEPRVTVAGQPRPKPAEITSSSSKENKDEVKKAGLLDRLLDGVLGIKIDLGNGSNKKPKTPPVEAPTKDWHTIPLYGDDGYVPRPLPEQAAGQPPCDPLPFRDQMIWDQQGDRGILVIVTKPPIPAPQPEPIPAPPQPKAPSVAPGVDEPPAPVAGAAEAEAEAEANANVDPTAETVDASGIRICVGGGCDDEDDREEKGEKVIRHKQKKFLKQFRGKALFIDSGTGCPLAGYKVGRHS
ncbi:hypothetical protein BGZ94_009297 [Podila epigama]|nr:hypothetical protein BGZ94_009297 [Podila epigama]